MKALSTIPEYPPRKQVLETFRSNCVIVDEKGIHILKYYMNGASKTIQYKDITRIEKMKCQGFGLSTPPFSPCFVYWKADLNSVGKGWLGKQGVAILTSNTTSLLNPAIGVAPDDLNGFLEAVERFRGQKPTLKVFKKPGSYQEILQETKATKRTSQALSKDRNNSSNSNEEKEEEGGKPVELLEKIIEIELTENEVDVNNRVIVSPEVIISPSTGNKFNNEWCFEDEVEVNPKNNGSKERFYNEWCFDDDEVKQLSESESKLGESNEVYTDNQSGLITSSESDVIHESNPSELISNESRLNSSSEVDAVLTKHQSESIASESSQSYSLRKKGLSMEEYLALGIDPIDVIKA